MPYAQLSEHLTRLGLSEAAIDAPLNSVHDLLEAVAASGSLYRQSITHILLRHVRTYFNKPRLRETDRLSPLMPYKARTHHWLQFKNSLPLAIPGLRASRITLLIGGTYALAVAIGFALSMTELVPGPFYFLYESRALSWFFVFALLPLAAIVFFGPKSLPARTVGQLIDQIMQLNMDTWLYDDKKELKEFIYDELTRTPRP